MERAARQGLRPAIHAIGDHAIDTLLTLMEQTMARNGPKERRWRIIHSQVLRDSSVARRYARSGIVAEVQPYHAIDDMRWMEERIGERVVVLVESVEDGVVEGRAAHQGPEVDGTTTLTGAAHARVGDLVAATVTGTDGVDLVARTDGEPA